MTRDTTVKTELGTQTPGVIRYWLEASVADPRWFSPYEIWAAEGTDARGGAHYGYGESLSEALTDLFRVMPNATPVAQVPVPVPVPVPVTYREGGMNSLVLSYMSAAGNEPDEARA